MEKQDKLRLTKTDKSRYKLENLREKNDRNVRKTILPRKYREKRLNLKFQMWM